MKKYLVEQRQDKVRLADLPERPYYQLEFLRYAW
jgi:hypothetical protein